MKARRVIAAAAASGVTGIGAAYALERRVALARRAAYPSMRLDSDLAIPASASSRFVETTDGARVHVVEVGEGTPIVLLHGVGLSSAIWAYQLRDLSHEHRVIAIDMRSHGQSLAGRDGCAMSRIALDLCEVLEHLDLEKSMLVGHSMGGMVVLQAMVDLGARIAARTSGIVLAGASAKELARAGVLGRRLAAGLVGRVLGFLDGAGRPLMASDDIAYWATRLSFGVDPVPAHVQLTEQLLNAMPPSTMASMLRSIIEFDVSGRLGEVPVPSLVIVGARDVLTPPWAARRLANELPRSTVYQLEGVGHMVMLERRQYVDAAIEQFVGATAEAVATH